MGMAAIHLFPFPSTFIFSFSPGGEKSIGDIFFF
jgi:hypothetical protein